MHRHAERVTVKFDAMRPLLDERTRRLWAAVQAKAIGRGGISWVAEATGMSRSTLRVGLQRLAVGVAASPQCVVQPERTCLQFFDGMRSQVAVFPMPGELIQDCPCFRQALEISPIRA